MDKQALDRHITGNWGEDSVPAEEPETASWFSRHPEQQVQLTFPPEVNAFLTGNRQEAEPAVLNLFRDLPAEEEQSFRDHARANYVVGSPINEVFHPVWRDEANRMNAEAVLGVQGEVPGGVPPSRGEVS